MAPRWPKFKRRLEEAREHSKRCDGQMKEWDCGCSMRCMGDGCDLNRECKKCGAKLRSDALDAMKDAP